MLGSFAHVHVVFQVIKTLGPLEHILNTPSHHRVHHGRNRYCIDKNYAGTLIIWDRIFGNRHIPCKKNDTPQSRRFTKQENAQVKNHIPVNLMHSRFLAQRASQPTGGRTLPPPQNGQFQWRPDSYANLPGTFAWEDGEIAYGLVHPLESWDPIYIQVCWIHSLLLFVSKF